ncbi:GNAT family N-acetyltransferase [Nesterenkonia suensis]
MARIDRATGGAVRVLTAEDTPALRRLIAEDPVSNVSVATTLAARGGAGAGRGRNGAVFLGIDDAGEADGCRTPEQSGSGATRLAAACWVGSNVNPVGADAGQAELFGLALRAMRRRISSVYGPAAAVLELYDAAGWCSPRDVREDQPLLTMEGPSSVEPLPGVRPAVPEDLPQVEPACAAMFTEELGFSPYAQGVSQYRERIRSLIADGHAQVLTQPSSGEVIFKAEYGAVTDDVVQVQGVWVRPDRRGQGLAEPGMSAVVAHALTLAPTVSLYVNSYNAPAIRAYRRVGFEQVGTFATVLF